MIKWFNEINSNDFLSTGGKGYNLALMFNNGIKVPNGFVVLSGAYDNYVQENNLTDTIKRILHESENSNIASQQVKALFTIDKMNPELKATILEEYKKITSGRVAVRSSSTMEDLPGTSFAGQYSTYLNVQEDDLLDKLILCWQSLWNERAIEYRNRYAKSKDFSHAVVIQEMVNSKISGVAFTANPINGLRDNIVINSAFGLGEAIVSGEVNPDQYTLVKSSGRLINKEISKKEIKYQYAGKGIESINLSTTAALSPSLTDNHLAKLVEACKITENYFGKPQDIEFAFDDNDDLYVIQSRDITTLYPIDALEQDGKLRAYMGAGTILLGMKEPFTPFGFDITSLMFPTIINVMTSLKKPLTNSFVKYAGGRPYIDITYMLSSKFVSKQFAKAFSGNDIPLKGVMDTLIEKYGKTFTNQGFKFKIPWGITKYSMKMLKQKKVVDKIPMEGRYDAMIEVGNKQYQELVELSKKLKTIEEKLDFCEQAMVKAFILSQAQALYCVEMAYASKIAKKLKKMYGSKYDPEILIQSLPRCVSQELTIKLNLLAKYFDEHDLEPTPEQEEFKKVLAKFGHRSSYELDFGAKRWFEDPSYLVNQVKSYMQNQMYKRNLEDIEKKRAKAEQFIEDVYEDMIRDYGKRRADKFKKLMVNYRIAAGMREYPKFDIVRFVSLGRSVALTIAEDFVRQDLIDDKYDIFFLRKADICSQKNLREIVAENKEMYNREMARNSIPRILLNTGETIYTSTKIDPNSKTITGAALSPGVYEGIVRVVYNPSEANLQEGEIMVTESTNPAWTPLFATAGALIMEYGGPMSHGGIVAREYGIPAVVGISSVTSMLKDGQRVRVNGEAGTIEIL